jgi:hypothetical protein
MIDPDGEHEAKNRQGDEMEDDRVVHNANSPVFPKECDAF